MTDTPKALMLAKLKESGLTEADAKTLGFQPFTEEESKKLKLSRAGAGFKIPYVSIQGKTQPTFRFRFFSTESKGGWAKVSGEKVRKYDQPQGTPADVYFPPLMPWDEIAADTGEAIYITEGELKAACACKHEICTIGTGGVWSFGSAKKGMSLLPALEQIEWVGRTVYIAYDSDIAERPDLMQAESALAKELNAHGALVFIIRIPPHGKNKVGLDDYLVAHGIEEFLKLANTAEDYIAGKELHRLNGEVVYIKEPSMIAELPIAARKPTITLCKVATFTKEKYVHRIYKETTANGTHEVYAAQEWMKWPSKATAEAIAYAPGQPLYVDHCLNMWQGWGVVPAKGDVSLWVEFLDYVFSESQEQAKWFLQWMAYPLQHPGAKMNTAVMLWSFAGGNGKTLIGETLGRVYGSNYHVIGERELLGSFNSWAEGRQLILAEEITGSDSRKDADTLKALITQQRITINKKYVPEYTTKDCANYILTSNRADALFIDKKDRRFFIHHFPESSLPDTFYKKYDKWYRTQEAAAAIFHWLLQIDCDDFNPMARAPSTTSKEEMIETVQSELGRWCHELATHPDNLLRIGKVVQTYSLWTMQELLQKFDPEGRGRVRDKGMGMNLRAAGVARANNGNPVALHDGTHKILWAVRDVAKVLKLKPIELSELYARERQPGGARPKGTKY